MATEISFREMSQGMRGVSGRLVPPRLSSGIAAATGVLTLVLASSFAALDCHAQSAEIGQAKLDSMLAYLDRYVEQAMQKTGVPGAAVAVVHRDRIVYLRGFGVREAGKTASVNPDTVFQLASVSKPLASTVVASLVGTRDVSWDSRIADIDPEFSLANARVTEQLTIRDLLSHRSGLATSSGDALEDLGFKRTDILRQMRLLPVPFTFRKDYMYSNFGYTEGAIAAAKTVDETWEDVAEDRLFRPLRMKSTSYRYSDYVNAPNRASIHVIAQGKAVARYARRADAEAPAGGASSSVRDLAKWLRLQLAGGYFGDRLVIDSTALAETHSPQVQMGTDSAGRPDYYGLGWDVSTGSNGKPVLSHSGAFLLGASTAVRFSPSQQIGILVLTNAQPSGLAEAVAFSFFDLIEQDEPSRDWLALVGEFWKQGIEAVNNAVTDYSKLTRPSNAAPSAPLSAYVGTYRNDYYGSIEITEQGGWLWMRLPGKGSLYTLMPWSGDQFTYRFEEEQGIGTRGVKFALGSTPQVTIDNLAMEGDGVFLRTKE